jgi:hypothetical protein
VAEVDPDAVRKAHDKLEEVDVDPDGVELRCYEDYSKVTFTWKFVDEEEDDEAEEQTDE